MCRFGEPETSRSPLRGTRQPLSRCLFRCRRQNQTHLNVTEICADARVVNAQEFLRSNSRNLHGVQLRSVHLRQQLLQRSCERMLQVKAECASLGLWRNVKEWPAGLVELAVELRRARS